MYWHFNRINSYLWKEMLRDVPSSFHNCEHNVDKIEISRGPRDGVDYCSWFCSILLSLQLICSPTLTVGNFNWDPAIMANSFLQNYILERYLITKTKVKKTHQFTMQFVNFFCEQKGDETEISRGGKPQLILIKSFIVPINLFANTDCWKFQLKPCHHSQFILWK